MALLRVFLLSVSFVGVCYGYGSGAPPVACVHMTPGHLSNGSGSEPLSPQIVESPFEVTVNKDKFGPNEDVEVTIGGTETFLGFLIQARSEGEEEPVGSFSDLMEEKMKFVPECSETYSNGAVTHTNQYPIPTPFESIALKWTAPDSEIGDITFYATVAQDHDIYWVKLESEKLTYNGFTVLSPTLSLLMLPVAAIFTRYL